MKNVSLPAVEALDLFKSFGNTKVLRGISLKVEAGTTLVIFGPNGAGKTTLIKTLAGIMRPTSGRVLIGGLDMEEHSQEAHLHLGLLSHQSYLYRTLSAEENLTFYGRMYGVANLKERIDEVLVQVGLTTRRHDRIAAFSRGMLQRLSLGRAILHKPQTLMLDEPDTGLDPQALATMWDILRQDNPNRTIIFTSHHFERALTAASEAVIIIKGKVAWSSPCNNLTLSTLNETYTRLTGEQP